MTEPDLAGFAAKLDGMSEAQMHQLLGLAYPATRDALYLRLRLFGKTHMVKLSKREIESLG